MNANSGFTLIELILVTVIIGILAGMVTLSFTGRAEQARVKAAEGDIATYVSAVELYALDHNDQYPESLDQLNGKYVRELRPDPWGTPYQYRVPGKTHTESFDIFSSGPDLSPNTDDDVDPSITKNQ